MVHGCGNNFSIGGAKIEPLFGFGKQKLLKSNQDNQIQSITMQYVFLKKYTIRSVVYSRRSWGIFENFCVKSNLTVCKVTFNCKLQKQIGEQDVLVVPAIILSCLCTGH